MINRSTKQLVVCPTKDKRQRLATIMHHRTKIQNSLEENFTVGFVTTLSICV